MSIHLVSKIFCLFDWLVGRLAGLPTAALLLSKFVYNFLKNYYYYQRQAIYRMYEWMHKTNRRNEDNEQQNQPGSQHGNIRYFCARDKKPITNDKQNFAAAGFLCSKRILL